MNIIITLKTVVKKWRDSLYSKRIEGKRAIGTIDQWNVLTTMLQSPVVYSGGAGKHITFETDLVEQYNATVYLFDPSPTGIEAARNFSSIETLHFSPIALSNVDGTITMYTPVRPDEGSFTLDAQAEQQSKVTFPCRSIPSLMRENGHSKIDILKIDIEGSEYDVLNSILDAKVEIDQICVEFHHFFRDIPKQRTVTMIERLRSAGYTLFHKCELDYSFCHNRLLDQ